MHACKFRANFVRISCDCRVIVWEEIATDASRPRNDKVGKCLHTARQVVAPYGFYRKCLHAAGTCPRPTGFIEGA